MFHEEKMINGVLHWRGQPDGQWQEYTASQLSFMLISSRENANAQRLRACHDENCGC